MNTIQIYGRHTSYNVQKVLWLCEELDLQYSLIETGGRFKGNDTAAFLSMNPIGKVPVLKHGDRVIWESNTIVRYLAECFAPGSWIASSAYERSLNERWMDWSLCWLEPAFVGVFWGYYRTEPAIRDNTAIQKNVQRCESHLQQLDQQLGSKSFLLAETPSVADIATGVFLHRLISIDLAIAIPKNILGWYERLSERAGYERWVMSDFTELEARSAY